MTNSPPCISIKISYTTPILCQDFSNCLDSLCDEYDHFCKKNGHTPNLYEEKIPLCIKEIRSGSIEVILTTPAGITMAAASMMPLILEHSQVLIEFGKSLKFLFDFFSSPRPVNENIPRRSCQNIKNITDTIVTNPDSSITLKFGEITNSKVIVQIGNIDAKEIQSNAAQALQQLPEQGEEEERKEVILVWQQVKKGEGCSKGRTGDKAIIESITDKPLNVYFSETASWAKAKMTAQVENPLTKAYLVDVTIKKLKGKPVAYSINYLHTELEID